MRKPKKIMGKVYAGLALLLLLFTTAIGSIPIFLLGLLKLLPSQRIKKYCTQKVDKIATLWSDVNNKFIDKSKPARWEITGMIESNPNDWYLVVANHQSWLDIVILQYLLNRKIPVLKFFIKDQLKWIPLLGFSWWVMGCPFMKRYTPAHLAKYPHKKGADLQATKKALKLFKKTPASLMSFVEGTRFTPQKKIHQNSPYHYLLKPKAGGISFVIGTMYKQVTQLLDVTIIYPKQKNSLWDFLSHNIGAIKIHVRTLPIPEQFLNSSILDDEEMQIEFRQWLNQRWAEKDQIIANMQPHHSEHTEDAPNYRGDPSLRSE